MNVSENHKLFLIKAISIVGSGGFIFGYDIGIISGTLSSLVDEFSLNYYEESLVVSILYAGSILGGYFGGKFCDKYGRWKTIQLQNLLFVIGALLTALATTSYILYIGRFIVGIAAAISGLADVPYLLEVSPSYYRGFISGQYEVLVSFGVFLSFLLALVLNSYSYGWRLAFLLPGILCFIQSILLFFLPESPKWLLDNGKQAELKSLLIKIHGIDQFNIYINTLNRLNLNIESDELMSIPEDILEFYKHFLLQQNQNRNSIECPQPINGNDTITPLHFLHKNDTDDKDVSFNESSFSPKLFGDEKSVNHDEEEIKIIIKNYLPSIQIVLLLQILSQVTGTNVIRNFAPRIFESHGVSDSQSLFYNVFLGLIKLIFTFLAVLKIEHLGRRRSWLRGIICVMIGMALMTIMLYICIFGSSCHKNETVFVVVFIISVSFIYAGFGFGYGPIPWIQSSELIPTRIRGRIMARCLIVSNITQLIVNFMFVPLTKVIGMNGVFLFFLTLNILTYCYSLLYIPESKDLTPYEILLNIKNKSTKVQDFGPINFFYIHYLKKFYLNLISNRSNRAQYNHLCSDNNRSL